ncbi:proline-rich protein 2-like [Elephas maximus indicus]|uniref:proline-rich protein 2-like n=1 Tax=Elephas maximus indicus TaxID=99487 RepID=UPI0021164B5C|nr:proline-rich protein 2-like [Elephas maximus indicus]
MGVGTLTVWVAKSVELSSTLTENRREEKTPRFQRRSFSHPFSLKSQQKGHGKGVLTPATGRGVRSSLFRTLPEQPPGSAPRDPGRETIRTHPAPRGPTTTTTTTTTAAAVRPQQPQRPADEARQPRRPSAPGRPFPGEVRHSSPQPRAPRHCPRPRPHRGSAQRAPCARPACLRPARPAPSLTPSHTPEPTGATTHPGLGQGEPRATRGGPSPESEAARQRGARQLRQVSSSWTLLLQPVAAIARAPPASVPLLRCSPLWPL